jgi:hypothetical protein
MPARTANPIGIWFFFGFRLLDDLRERPVDCSWFASFALAPSREGLLGLLSPAPSVACGVLPFESVVLSVFSLEGLLGFLGSGDTFS